MKRVLLFALIFALSNFPAIQASAAERLLFEQTGPANANGSLMPFSIQTGPIADTTRDIVFVTPETYSDVSKLVEDPSGRSSFLTTNSWSFQVTVLSEKDTSPNKIYTISRKGMLSVIKRLETMYEKESQIVPDFILAIDGLLTTKK